ncbi:helix-turn-helix domain-containing protein [Bradyrhizobium sediminis]|nr:response regulator transcription factor [Bradyrhizobium sediminis]
MARRTATVIIEPHLLVREALESLIKNYRYRVVCSSASAADINDPAMVGDGPKLVILGAETTDDAVAEAINIRKLWANSKIVLLFEHASAADFQKLLTSEVDGCVPLFASPETLIRTLDFVTFEDARVVVLARTKSPAIRPSPKDKSHQPELGTDEPPSGDTEHETGSVNVVPMPPARPTVSGCSVAHLDGHEDGTHWTPPLQNHPRLSERETQILDGLVQGHANKTIARSCDITEATVKVHMKSILRKIQVANRTQAAVWALEHGHPIHQIKDAC